MLVFYIWRLRVIWSSFVAFSVTRRWLQIGRLVVDTYGGHGIVWRQRRIL
jgi:hypothetical protein